MQPASTITMSPIHEYLQQQTRRQFFGSLGIRAGGIALASMLGNDWLARGAMAAGSGLVHPSLAGLPHHFARAKRLIYLHMNGGPSQLDLFDYKPQLKALNGKPIPESYTAGKRFAFMDSSHGSN